MFGLAPRLMPRPPRIDPPARAGEGSADIHRGPVGGEETREDERRRPVLRASRAQRGQVLQGSAGGARRLRASGCQPGRRKVVRVNRAGSPGSRGSLPLHAMKWYISCVTETISRWNQLCLFQELSISRTTSRAARADTPNAMWVQSSSTSLSRSSSSPRAARGAMSPSRRDQMRQVRHRRLVGDPRDRRLVDLVPGDPLVQPPDIVLLADRPRRASPSVTTARTRSGTARASSRANSPPRLQPTSRIGRSRSRSRRAARSAARPCRLARPGSSPCFQPWTRQPAVGERPAQRHRGPVAARRSRG